MVSCRQKDRQKVVQDLRLLEGTSCMLISANTTVSSCRFLRHTVAAKGLPLDPTKIAIVQISFILQVGLAQVTNCSADILDPCQVLLQLQPRLGYSSHHCSDCSSSLIPMLGLTAASTWLCHAPSKRRACCMCCSCACLPDLQEGGPPVEVI